MRILFIFVAWFGFVGKIAGQDKLWGTVQYGGHGLGLIYNLNADGSEFNVIKIFEVEALNPTGALVNDGTFFYGITHKGGNHDGGILFKIKENGSSFSALHHFNGERPNGGLVLLNGFLYGTTWKGGAADFGTIYKIKPDGTDFTIIHEFNGMSTSNTGVSPNDGLMVAFDGNIYGTTRSGGANGVGVIFRINGTTDMYSKIYTFGSGTSENPFGDLIELSDGFLYGTSSGDFGGTLFKVKKDGTGFVNMHTFNVSGQGTDVFGTLVQSIEGKIYGTFSNGGLNNKGGIYRINPDGTSYEVVRSFDGSDGQLPNHRLVIVGEYIYGTTPLGGANAKGTFYKLKTADGTFTKILDLSNETGSRLGLTTHLGSLFFSSYDSGPGGAGAIGKMNESTKTVTLLKDFNLSDGGRPNGRLMRHSNGGVYGLATTGGMNGTGTIFRIDPLTNDFEVVFSFPKEYNGFGTSLIEDKGGTVLGVVQSTGSELISYIFRFEIETNNFSTVLELENELIGSIWQVYTGDFFGNTLNHSNGSADLFKVDSTFSNYKMIDGTLYSRDPWIVSQRDTSFLMLGVAGGSPSISSNGRILTYDFSTGEIGRIHNFDYFNDLNGAGPRGELSILDNGKLLGVTSGGGSFNGGILFSINLDGTDFLKLHNFPNWESPPIAGVTKISDDVFFGVLEGYFDSEDKAGAVFRYHVTEGFSIVQNFGDVNAYYPTDGLLRTQSNASHIKMYGDLKFGTVEVKDSSQKKLTIKNFGSGPLVVTDIALPAGFSINVNTFTLNPGEAKELIVTFEPLTEERYAGPIVVTSNAIDGINSIPVSGRGLLVTGIEESLSAAISVYPNPTKQNVLVQTELNVQNINVINSMGTVVSDQHHSSNEHNSYEVVLENLPPGIYMVHVENEHGVVWKKVVKQ